MSIGRDALGAHAGASVEVTAGPLDHPHERPSDGGLDAPIEPRPARSRRDVLVEDLAWIAKFVGPWAWRRLRGRTLGDGRDPKRPQLTPVV